MIVDCRVRGAIPLVPLVALPPCSPLKYADFSGLAKSFVSVRLMPLVLTGLGGFEWPPLRSSIFILLSWWCSAAEPFVRPALSAWPGNGVCGVESNV